MLAMDPTAPPLPVATVPWDQFYAYLSREWQPGEHVAVVGPTGRGKTTLILALAPLRKWVMYVATKPQDETIERLPRQGWRKIKAWPPPPGARRVILWPPMRGRADVARQARAIRHALDRVFVVRAWAVVLDDLQYLMEDLHLVSDVKMFLNMARSLKVTLILSTQRPRHVPVAVWTQCTHLFIYGTRDHDDLRRLGGLGGLDDKAIRQAVAELDRHSVLYVNLRTGHLAVTKAPKGNGRG
jgi:hypothetical protein